MVSMLSSFDFTQKQSADEDPDRLIYPWTSHIPVPKWVDKNAYPNCKHCKAQLKIGHKHNCRLCGEMFCSACTGKYHLPSAYELKGKTGTSRVCMHCRDSCLEQKQKEKEAEAAALAAASTTKKYNVLKSLSADDDDFSPPSKSSSPSSPKSKEIAPPVWDPIENYVDCAKCRKKGGKAHNCRVCGKLFCPKCTSKMQVPSFFEKKGKEGPSRVCDGCRFLIISGAKLVEKIEDPEVKAQFDSTKKKWGPQSSARSCLVAGCRNARVTKKGYCANHANSEDMNELASDVSLSIRYEGQHNVISKVAVVSPDMTLTEIDRLFKRVSVEPPYNYTYNNEIIPLAFFDVFTAKVFNSNLYIRPRQVGLSEDLVSQYDAVSVASASSSARSSIDEGPKKNPFKRSEVDAAKEEQKKKQEAEETKKSPAFKKPEFRRGISPLVATQTTSAFPSPPSSAAAAPAPPPALAATNGVDPFKARAMNVFGAK